MIIVSGMITFNVIMITFLPCAIVRYVHFLGKLLSHQRVACPTRAELSAQRGMHYETFQVTSIR